MAFIKSKTHQFGSLYSFVTIGLSKEIWWYITSAVAYELVCKFAECLVKDVIVESEDGYQVQEVQCSTSSIVSNVQHVMKSAEPVTEKTDSNISSSTVQYSDEDNNVLEGESEKHSISAEVRC